ncbi:MAG: hypothetical protein FJ399_00425 [Verrucomicrobia bacterium]|nr:hypothetical protein [Verrucomicrobiota bacterium]
MAAALALAGCVGGPSAAEARIVRFVPVPAALVEAAATSEALARGFSRLPDGRWQWVVARKKDPILGVVAVEGDPPLVIRYALKCEAVTEEATRVVLEPVAALKTMLRADYRETPLGAGARGELAAMLDVALAEAQAAWATQASVKKAK